MTDDQALPARVRRLLETAPPETLPMTYQQLAEALGLQPPRTIQRVAKALETLIREDAEHARPFIAALVVSRLGKGCRRKASSIWRWNWGGFPPTRRSMPRPGRKS